MAPRPRADENSAPSNRPAKRAPGKAPALDQLVSSGGASRCEETGDWALADAFRFRQQMAQEVVQNPEFKEELVTALAKEWSDPAKLDALLRPSVGSDSSANDSLVRLLLHVDALQGDIASGLMQLLPEYQEEEAGPGGVPVVRLILSQFRWLERIVDGAALVETASEILQVRPHAAPNAPSQCAITRCSHAPPLPLRSRYRPPTSKSAIPTLPPVPTPQVADAPLKRELLLVLPDLVEDGQHASAAQTLRAVLAEDTRFLACVLDAFGALVLEEETLAEVRTSGKPAPSRAPRQAPARTRVVDVVRQPSACSLMRPLPPAHRCARRSWARWALRAWTTCPW
jgi:Fanconi anemia group D2 protein